MSEDAHEAAWTAVKHSIVASRRLDNKVFKKRDGMKDNEFLSHTHAVFDDCRASYRRYLSTLADADLSDETILSHVRFTDGLPLRDYQNVLSYVPSLVNLVSLADALPLDGSSLPFALKKIAVRCRNAIFFAPRRFTAVQLAFDSPRSRVLLFHTGRLVGTGCDSAHAAKIAVARAVATIAKDAGVLIGIRRFSVINQVAAVNLAATIDCNAFATAHASDSHYDAKSFVGLAYRPAGESICAETYSTGKANLPGSRRERDILRSFARIAPELLRFSNKRELRELFPAHVRDAHDVGERAAMTEPPAKRVCFAEELGLEDDGGLDELFGA